MPLQLQLQFVIVSTLYTLYHLASFCPGHVSRKGTKGNMVSSTLWCHLRWPLSLLGEISSNSNWRPWTEVWGWSRSREENTGVKHREIEIASLVMNEGDLYCKGSVVWFLDQMHQPHLRNFVNIQILCLIPGNMNQKLWSWGHPGGPDAWCFWELPV